MSKRTVLALVALALAMASRSFAMDQAEFVITGHVWRVDVEYNSLGVSRTLIWVRSASMVSFGKLIPIQCSSVTSEFCDKPKSALFDCLVREGTTAQLNTDDTPPVRTYPVKSLSCLDPTLLGKCIAAGGDVFLGKVEGGFQQLIMNPGTMEIRPEFSCTPPSIG